VWYYPLANARNDISKFRREVWRFLPLSLGLLVCSANSFAELKQQQQNKKNPKKQTNLSNSSWSITLYALRRTCTVWSLVKVRLGKTFPLL